MRRSVSRQPSSCSVSVWSSRPTSTVTRTSAREAMRAVRRRRRAVARTASTAARRAIDSSQVRALASPRYEGRALMARK